MCVYIYINTHTTQPTRPEEQGSAGGAPETEGAASVRSHFSVDIRDAGGMGTHFISSPENPEAQAEVQVPASLGSDLPRSDGRNPVFFPEEGAAAVGEAPSAVGAAMVSSSRTASSSTTASSSRTMSHEPRDAGVMPAHFTYSHERPAAQGEASGVAVEEAAAPRGVAGAHVHSSDDEVAEFGTHFIGSKNVFAAPPPGKTADTQTAWAASTKKSAYSRSLLPL
jgi:hypothetical protein